MPVTTPPAGQNRRISSFMTTFNFFKSPTKVISPQRRELALPPPPRNNHINSGPLIALIAEEGEDISPTELPRPPTRVGTEPAFDSQSYQSSRLHSNSSFDRIGRPRRDTLTGSSSIPIPNGAAEIEVMTTAVRGASPGSRGGVTADAEQRPGPNYDKQSTSAPSAGGGGGGKKTAAKLRMALSLLRRRSNPNLRKAYVEPVDEAGENWVPFNDEPLLDPDSVEPARQRNRSPQRRGSFAKPNGFKFTLPVRSNSRALLAKNKREDQPRRATLASITLDKETAQVNSVWNDIEARPRSSQSTLPGENMVADPSESVFSRESIAVGAPSPAAGGLFPRPASLQRHWSDGLRKQAETATERKPTAEGGVIGIGITSPIPRLRQSSFHDPDRIRPLSFNGVSNGYGSMKITEAAALESRVGELEAQVADLRSIIAESANWLPSRPVPFDDGVLRSSPSHSFSRPDSDTAVAPDESILRFESISPRGSVAARDRSLAALEGITFDNENKRHTVSTIRGPRRGSTSMRSTSDSPHSVNLAEYTGIVAMVKREQKARKRLEQQVATLQEQMAAVLHRQLVSESTSRSATMLDTHRRLNAHLHRKASSEVPTPDITPPASSAARQSANMFTSFDHAISDGEEEDEEDGVGSFYDGHGQSDAWGTPAEEKGDAMSALERTGTHQTFGDPLMGFSPQARTLSLSRITRDSSLMAQRV